MAAATLRGLSRGILRVMFRLADAALVTVSDLTCSPSRGGDVAFMSLI